MSSASKDFDTRLDEHTSRRLRVLLDAMPVPISWATLSDAHITFMNRKFFQVFGYTVEDFPTVQEWVDKAYPNPEHQARAAASWFKYFSKPTVHEFEIEPVEVDVKCKDGAIKTAILGGVILPEAGLALATFVDISDRKRDEMLIRHLAEQDQLTGLPNRRSFDAYLARAIADARRDRNTVHLLLLDLDHFKQVNDRYGHPAGDKVLKEASKRFKTCIRSSDIVARFGGDEFGIILANAGNDGNIDRICEKIIEAFAEPIPLPGNLTSVGVSIGISRFPKDADDDRGLFASADKGLYRAKGDGRRCWRYENVSS